MTKLELSQKSMTLLSRSGDSYRVLFPAKDGGVSLPELITCPERYLTFFAEALTDHSVALNLCFYTAGSEPVFSVVFGLLPHVKALVCADLNWLDAGAAFPERNPGQLKIFCTGRRVERNELTRVVLENLPCFHDVACVLSDLTLTDEFPAEFPLPDIKLVDEFGQYKLKDWPGKIQNGEMLKERLTHLSAPGGPDHYPAPDWNQTYGSCKALRFGNGAGFFSKVKENGRWWLTDPDGYAFFSVGVGCTAPRIDCRIDGIETFMDWLPDRADPVFGGMYHAGYGQWQRRTELAFAFEQANLYRAFGTDWYKKWLDFMPRRLKKAGVNTIGNWSDHTLCDTAKMPYVDQLPRFPGTKQLIFRDFPDVLSEEYRQNASECAEYLKPRARDPYLIGYFLRNEPLWAFVDNLILADEALRCPARTECKAALLRWLREKYGNIEALNCAWEIPDGRRFTSFEALDGEGKASAFSPAACKDMREFSRVLLRAYIEIPARACRAADPNHMILGMRWAWISDQDIITGWENFDVFSINCYQPDPAPSVEHIVNMGVDLPVMIGEFQFGALDRGPVATGLWGAATQDDRAKAYRYYCERLASHPNGVGCHYFQCYDQFALGRFDGENYNIGLFDICSQPYGEQQAGMRESSNVLYRVMSGERAPYDGQANYIPKIAY